MMKDPYGSTGWCDWMHYYAGGVVEVEGDDNEKAKMGSIRICTKTVCLHDGIEENKVEIEYELKGLKGDIEESSVPIEAMTKGKTRV